MRPDTGHAPAPGVWLVRIVVLGAFVATLILAGPTAWRSASAQLRRAGGGGAGVPVAMDRVSAFHGPDWLRGPLLRVVLEDLEPRLRGEVRLMDDDGARRARERISKSPFVTDVRLERSFPDRFRVMLDLRRPEVQIVADEAVVALLDADGHTMPAFGIPVDLPQVVVDGYSPPVPLGAARIGAAFPDPRIVAAAAVAREWREIVAPEVGAAAPPLQAVDARNVGWHWIADLSTSQMMVGVGTVDGRTCWFHYGLADVDGGRIGAATRAEVLRSVVAAHPGLRGLVAGDLRLRNRWRDLLRFGIDAPDAPR